MKAADLPEVRGCTWILEGDTAQLNCPGDLQIRVYTQRFDEGKVRSRTILTMTQGDETFTYPMKREDDAIAMAAELAAADTDEGHDVPSR